jgi:hypothetical protein
MKRGMILTAAAAACLAGCAAGEPEVALAESAQAAAPVPAPDGPVCRVADAGDPLPVEVKETSGLAQSRRDPELFWTHNDSGNDAELFALDASGRLVDRVRVAGAEIVDWEDIEAGPCEEGSCLYVGDIGDNDAARERITIYRVPEPEADASTTEPAAAIHARFPDGVQDTESLFLLPSGELYVVTKGRHGPIALYRVPSPRQPDETVTLERVRELFPQPEDEQDRVTSATASPDGRWVGIRSYRNLYLYPSAELVAGGAVEPTVVDLEPLGQEQGESVTISPDGAVWLTSESESKDGRPTWARLQCTFPAG